MTNKTALVNMAITKIGKSRITDYATDTSEESVLGRLFFDELRDEILEEGPWSFAIRRVELGLLATTPSFGWDYEHQLPTDCLSVLNVDESVIGDIPYKVEERKVLSDESSLKILYLVQVTDVSQWSALFKKAFVLRLAAEMSYTLKADKNLTISLFKQYELALQRGLSIDGKQGSNERISSADLLEVR